MTDLKEKQNEIRPAALGSARAVHALRIARSAAAYFDTICADGYALRGAIIGGIIPAAEGRRRWRAVSGRLFTALRVLTVAGCVLADDPYIKEGDARRAAQAYAGAVASRFIFLRRWFDGAAADVSRVAEFLKFAQN